MNRIIALLLTFSIVLSLTACGTKEKTTVASSNESNTASNESNTAANGETINLSTVKIIDSSMVFEDSTADNNVFHDEVLRDLNIKVNYKWIADISQTDAKFATMIASGDIPDYFNVADAKLAFQLIEDGYVMDITEVYEKYASPELKARDAGFPEAHNSMIKDGKLYGISELGYGNGVMLNIVWIRSDWLQQSGKEIPKTMDELFALADYFKTNIPGCEYGISLDKSITTPTEHNAIPIMNAYDAYAKIWTKADDGSIVYSSVQPEMKTVLAKLQELYKSGILSKEFSVKEGGTVNQDVASGKVGIVNGVNWIGYSSLGGTVALDTKATWIPIEIPTLKAGDPMVKLQSAWPVTGYWLINKNCKNPEAVIELFNYFVKNENNGVYSDAKYAKAGGIYGGSPVYQTNPDDGNKLITAAIEKDDATDLPKNLLVNYNQARSFLKDGDASYYGAAAMMGPEGIGANYVVNKYVDSKNYVLTEMRGAMPADYAKAYGTLEALEDEYFTRIIMGEPISLFDEFVQKWNYNGGEAATKQVNEMYGVK